MMIELLVALVKSAVTPWEGKTGAYKCPPHLGLVSEYLALVSISLYAIVAVADTAT